MNVYWFHVMLILGATLVTAASIGFALVYASALWRIQQLSLNWATSSAEITQAIIGKLGDSIPTRVPLEMMTNDQLFIWRKEAIDAWLLKNRPHWLDSQNPPEGKPFEDDEEFIEYLSVIGNVISGLWQIRMLADAIGTLKKLLVGASCALLAVVFVGLCVIVLSPLIIAYPLAAIFVIVASFICLILAANVVSKLLAYDMCSLPSISEQIEQLRVLKRYIHEKSGAERND